MKKLIPALLLPLCATLFISVNAMASDAPVVTINGEVVQWTDAEPFVNEDWRTMVPLRAAANAMGLDVEWNADENIARFTRHFASKEECPYAYRHQDGSYASYVEVEFMPYLHTMVIRDEGSDYEKTRFMDTATTPKNNRVYAPIRYLANAVGYSVEWDAENNVIVIEEALDAINGWGEKEWLCNYKVDNFEYPSSKMTASEYKAWADSLESNFDFDMLDEAALTKVVREMQQWYVPEFIVTFPTTYSKDEVYEFCSHVNDLVRQTNTEFDIWHYNNLCRRVESTGRIWVCIRKTSIVGYGETENDVTWVDNSFRIEHNQESYQLARTMLSSLYQDGKLWQGMDEYSRANAIYNACILKWKYGVYDGYNDLCRGTAWTVLKEQLGVCSAMTRAYNMLLKMDGLVCREQANDKHSHCWTVAMLDNKEYHIDVTWHESLDFALTAQAIRAEKTGTHIWTEDSHYMTYDNIIV